MTGKNKGRGSRLTPEDAALWEQATRGYERFPGREYVEPQEEKQSAPEFLNIPCNKDAASAVNNDQAFLPLEEGVAAGVDGRTLERLRRGKLPIEGKLDLHGYTLDQACAALNVFLAAAQHTGKRCVLIVTGRGLKEGVMRGVIRHEFPHWLHSHENRARVLAYSKARPQHGGEGAFYVLLRKRG